MPVVHDFASFARVYRDLYQLDGFTILYRPVAGQDAEALVSSTDQVLSLVTQVETQERRGLALIFEEVWLYAPLHACPPWLTEIALTGRHHNISIVANSQRPAHVSKTLVTQSRHVFIGQFFEHNDRKYLRETLGNLECLENPPPPGEFIWFRPSAPLERQRVSVF